MEHVDRAKLYSDGEYRFRYFTNFIEFGDADIEAIAAVSKQLKEAVSAVVDAVYVKLFSFDITKATFLEKNAGFNGPQAKTLEELTLDDEVIKFRKSFLNKYFNRLLTGPFDGNLQKYLDRVGKLHIDTPDKQSKVHVDYIHCSALLALCQTILINGIYSLDLDRELERRAVIAFGKVLWIQNDYFAKYYTVESIEAYNTKSKDLEKKKTSKAITSITENLAMSLTAGSVIGMLAYFGTSFFYHTTH